MRTEVAKFRAEPDVLALVKLGAQAERCTVSEFWRRAGRQRAEEVLRTHAAENHNPFQKPGS